MMFLKLYCGFVLVILEIFTYTIEIKLKQGKIIGTREQTIFDGRLYYAFYGVPYAQPPVGKLRFKDPQPPKKWKKPYDSTVNYHGSCAQAHIVHKHGLHGVEDCLYMNIYIPELPRQSGSILKPVLVYLHGYAFASSLSHVYGADFLINKDIVLVTITHRIGIFGFLKVNDSDSDVNMGLKDIVMALKWIRTNIQQFGGDKDKLTLMGSDSGATFVSLLLMTKHRKLFSKMILQSGTLFSPSVFQGNYQKERIKLKENLIKMGHKDILSAPAKDIIAASQKIYNSKELINFQRPVVPFTPVLENKSNTSLLIHSPEEFYLKLMHKNINIPVLLGFSSRESIPELIPFIHNPQYLRSFSPYFKFMVPYSNGCSYNYTTSTYREVADKIKLHYFNNHISEDSLDSFLQYTSDLKVYPIWKFIQSNLQSNKMTMFVYKFNYGGSFNAVKATSVAGVKTKVKGASNGDELCYIFKCRPLLEKYGNISKDPNNQDRIFIAQITDLWGNFVKTGNPTPSSQSSIVWQPMTSKQTSMLHLGKVTKTINSKLETKMYLFWNEIYQTYFSKDHCINKVHEEL